MNYQLELITYLNKIYDKKIQDILQKENLKKLKETAGKYSTSALSGTFNTLTVVISMYFILYFMFEKPRLFERILTSSAPLKRANVAMIGEKMRKLIMANATSNQIQDQAITEGMMTMQVDGIIKAFRGNTTIEEVIRVTKES